MTVQLMRETIFKEADNGEEVCVTYELPNYENYSNWKSHSKPFIDEVKNVLEEIILSMKKLHEKTGDSKVLSE